MTIKLSHKQMLDYVWEDLQRKLLEKIYSPIHMYFQEKLKDLILKNNNFQSMKEPFTGFVYKNETYDLCEFYPTYALSTLFKFKVISNDSSSYLALLDTSLEPEFLKIKKELDSTLEEYTKVKRAITIIFTKLSNIEDIKALLNISFENIPVFNMEYTTKPSQKEEINQLKLELTDELFLIQSRLLDNILSE